MGGMLDLVFGRVTFRLEGHHKERVLNLLYRNGVSPIGATLGEKGEFCFGIRLTALGKVKSLLDKSGIKDYSIRGEGLPFLLKRYKRRYGIAAGAFILCCMLWASKSYVWQIEFKGNDSISDEVVEKQLLEAGFGVGSYIPEVDFYSLCNSFLMASEDFSYISVNMDGTTAEVQLRERKVKNEDEVVKSSNLVAKYSGQIESMTVYSGAPVVTREEVVLEGQLLVSGFLEKQFGFEVVRSRGCVYAYVTRDLKVEVDYERQVKEYTGRRNTGVTLSFFGRELSLYKRKEGEFELSDSFADRERLILFDRIRLPVTLTKYTEREYGYRSERLTEEGARQEAEKQLSALIQTELETSEILERRVTETVGEESYTLECQVYCITDIALEKEISTEQDK